MIKTLALVAVVQAALVPMAVAPQLSARIAGDEYRLLVQPVDPIDPFRGAYVDLGYPGKRHATEIHGQVFVPLVEDEDGLWRLGRTVGTRPDESPYLSCHADFGEVRCGIESWFASQDEALRLEESLAADGAIVTLKVDSRGNAAITALDPR